MTTLALLWVFRLDEDLDFTFDDVDLLDSFQAPELGG